MKDINKKDLRVKKTINAIYQAFEKMIDEMEYERMTVKELSERAQINKKTFYNYYSSLDELLVEIQENISDEYIEKISVFKIPEELDKINREFFLFSERSSKIYAAITLKKNLEYMRQKMINKVMNATWNKSEIVKKLDKYKLNLLFAYIQPATLALYSQWVEDGRKIPIEEVIELSNRILCDGIQKFLE